MRITIQIDTSNAAFQPPVGAPVSPVVKSMYAGREVVRILAEWVAKCVSAQLPVEQKLLDYNGNPVGVVKIEYDEEHNEHHAR